MNGKNSGTLEPVRTDALKFKNRHEAGQFLARELAKYRNQGVVVFALPKGGVPVAYEVAKSIHAPLDTIIAQKLGVPGNPEYGFGALSAEGVIYLNRDPESVGIQPEDLKTIITEEHIELERKTKEYGSGNYAGENCRIAIIVDDGLATGVSARAAIMAVKKKHKPEKIVLAVPVCPAEAAAELAGEVDEFVSLSMPPDFWAVSQWYHDFEQLMDEEVVGYVERAQQELTLRGDRRS